MRASAFHETARLVLEARVDDDRDSIVKWVTPEEDGGVRIHVADLDAMLETSVPVWSNANEALPPRVVAEALLRALSELRSRDA